MDSKSRSRLLSDKNVLAEVGLTQDQLYRAIRYLNKKNIVMIEDSPFCHCSLSYEVLVYIGEPSSYINYRAGCPSCSQTCPECDDYVEKLMPYATSEGETREMCYRCLQEAKQNKATDDLMELDADDYEKRVDAILKETRLRGNVVEPGQRLISGFCAPVRR